MTNTTTMTVEQAAEVVLDTLAKCKGAMQRGGFCSGTLRRPDSEMLRVGVDWALERGLVEYRPLRWMYRTTEEMALFVTKAGRAWLQARQ